MSQAVRESLKKKWETPEEVALANAILQSSKENKKLEPVFQQFAASSGRTIGAVKVHWYANLRKRIENGTFKVDEAPKHETAKLSRSATKVKSKAPELDVSSMTYREISNLITRLQKDQKIYTEMVSDLKKALIPVVNVLNKYS